MPINLKAAEKMRTAEPIEITVLDNGDGKVDPYARQKKGPNRGAVDAVKIVSCENGKRVRQNVTISEFLGPKYDHLGSVEFRKNLIYGTGKRTFETASGGYIFNVKWRWANGATRRFHNLVRHQDKRYTISSFIRSAKTYLNGKSSDHEKRRLPQPPVVSPDARK